jgi:hypothetical protein
MAYTDRATLATSSSDFLGRVQAACLDYCLVVQAEGTGVANHDVRQTFADLMFADATGGYARQMAWLVSGDGTNDSSDDPTIIARVAALWTQAASLACKQSAS